MENYIKYRNGIRIDMMGNYHGGCKKSCCQNSWGFPTKKGINNNCKIKLWIEKDIQAIQDIVKY